MTSKEYEVLENKFVGSFYFYTRPADREGYCGAVNPEELRAAIKSAGLPEGRQRQLLSLVKKEYVEQCWLSVHEDSDMATQQHFGIHIDKLDNAQLLCREWAWHENRKEQGFEAMPYPHLKARI